MVTTLVVSLAVTGLAYVGARIIAENAAEAGLRPAVGTLSTLISQQGAALMRNDGHLVIGVDVSTLVLNGNTTLVDQVQAATHDDMAIYQSDGGVLTAIATTIPAHNQNTGARAVGSQLTGAARAALAGQCVIDRPACHATYLGETAVAGTTYLTYLSHCMT